MQKRGYEKKCTLNTWDTIGYQEGNEGLSKESLQKYLSNCIKVQGASTVNQGLYIDGWRKGIAKYCQGEGYKQAREGSGQKIPQNCLPKEQRRKFLFGFDQGVKEYCTYTKGHELGSKGGVGFPQSCQSYPRFSMAYKEALGRFCAQSSAFNLGLNNVEEVNFSNCGESSEELKTTYSKGKEVNVLKEEIEILNKKIRASKKILKRYETSSPEYKQQYSGVRRLESSKARIVNKIYNIQKKYN